jgi:hypothetical protein
MGGLQCETVLPVPSPKQQSPQPHSPLNTSPPPSLPLGTASTLPGSIHSSPSSSSEQLDWGSIDEEDGAFAVHSSLQEEAVQELACSPPRAAPGGADPTPPLMLPQGGSGDRQSPAQAVFKTALSPNRNLGSGGRRPDVLNKLKSVLVIPEPASANAQPACIHGGEQSQKQNLLQEWTLVKSKRGARATGQPSSATPPRRSIHHALPAARNRLLQPELKKAFKGKCFRCLATDHQVANCREPSRCINCLGRGHFARHCRLPPALLQLTSVHSRLMFSKSSIHSRLTFPPGSIHSRLVFPELSYAAAASSPANHLASEGYVAGVPHQRPAYGQVAFVATGAMAANFQRLRRKAVLLSSHDVTTRERAADVAYELHRQLLIPHWNIAVSPHRPENFLVLFDYPEQRDSTLRAGAVHVGASTFIIQPWHLEGVNRPASWFFHVKICIERMPLHAWSAEDVKQVLGDVCMFDHMESDTFRRRNTEVFTFYAWMANPDDLPRASTATFFSSLLAAPAPATAHHQLEPSPLHHRLEWTSPSSSTLLSTMTGLPSHRRHPAPTSVGSHRGRAPL